VYKDKIYCNPGSVGQPRDRNSKAAYAIIEDGKISLHRVQYNMEKVFELMKEAGFYDSIYDSLEKEDRYYVGFRNR